VTPTTQRGLDLLRTVSLSDERCYIEPHVFPTRTRSRSAAGEARPLQRFVGPPLNPASDSRTVLQPLVRMLRGEH
jgi:hypothetical protein